MVEKTERYHCAPSPLWVFSALSALSVLSAPLSAQVTRASGRVVTADSTLVRGVPVVLHRIGRETQGPLDSTRSDPRGRFRFTFRPDTAAFYLLSARRAGIEYFSQPLATNPEQPDTGIHIIVYDTSSTTPISLGSRHLVITRPGEDGSRSVLDLIILRNEGRTTRVAPDTVRPSWSAPLPAGTIGLELGESDVSADAVRRRGDSLIVTAPLAPGEKQLTVQYLVPSNRATVELPFDRPGTTFNVMVEEKEARVSGPGIARADTQVIQGRFFRRWTGVAPAAGVVRVRLPGRRREPQWLLTGLVAALSLSLGAAAWYLWRRRGEEVARVAPDQLVEAIAAMDARYLGREGETPVEEWRFYQVERARLKSELEASLAADGWSR